MGSETKQTFLDILPHSVLKFVGQDTNGFLQRILTVNLNDLEKDQSSTYAMMLNSKGRFQFDLFLTKIPDGFLIDLANQYKESFLNKILLYKLKSDVRITDLSSEYYVTYSHKPGLNALTSTLYQGIDPRSNKINLGIRTIASKKEIDYLVKNKTIWIDKELYLDYKYANGIVDGITDLIQDKSFPQEYGAENLGAISYTKGCYIGQETISRIHTQGVVRNKIFKIVAESTKLPQEQLEVFADEDFLGTICSSYKNLAIALLNEDKLNFISADSELNQIKLSNKQVNIRNQQKNLIDNVKIYKPLWR